MRDVVSAAASDYVPATLKKVFESAVVAVKAMWHENDISTMMDELADLRQQIVMCMMLNLNAKADAHSEDMGSLKSAVSGVAEVLAIYQERQKSSLSGHTQHLAGRMQESDVQARRFHDETIAAILTLKNGETRILKPPGEETDASELNPRFSNSHRTAMRLTSGVHGTAKVLDLNSMEQDILNSLYFRQMTDRFETVRSPQGHTYEWIFCNSAEANTPWDDFTTWLREGSGCYWINGKAGSGKSTLMKFIYQHPQTRLELSRWAGTNSLVVGSFFFWGLGNTAQKSQGGLLRSLLHDILSNEPQLISATMPEMLREAAAVGEGERLAEPSHAELIRWFKNVLGLSKQHQYFFLIDGIDEYGGDPSQLLELIASISRTQMNVKFLLSSRPIPVCVDNFAQFPKLHLHDFTREDIRQYAEARLGPRLRQKGQRWATLVDQIVEKSSGVFVWVEVSIQSMLRGLENRDRMAELEKRLDELPSDLADLYSHMLRGLSPLYRQQAAQLFQLALEAIKVQTFCPITTLQMSFADDDAVETLDMPIQRISKEDEMQRSDEISGRLRSRCCGLLETRRAKPSEKKMVSCFNYEFPCVDVFHRTVVEFLTDQDVWNDICALAAESFAPLPALFNSCVRMCKAAPLSSLSLTVDVDSSLVWQMMRNAAGFALEAEEARHPVPSIYLRELDKVMAIHWKRLKWASNRDSRRRAEGHWAGSFLLVSPITQETETLAASLEPVDFGSLAIAHYLVSYVKEELSLPTSRFRNEPDKSRYLFDATTHLLSQPLRKCDATRREFTLAIICELLLEAGADPNAKLGKCGETPWDLILKYALEEKRAIGAGVYEGDSPGRPRFMHLLATLAGSFITAGADVNAKVLWRTKRYRGDDEPVVFHRTAVMIADWAFPEHIKNRLLENGAVALEFQNGRSRFGLADENRLDDESSDSSKFGITASDKNRYRLRRRMSQWLKRNVSGS